MKAGATRRRDAWALVNVLVLSAVVSALVVAVVLAGLGGWSYYTTPLGVRGYGPSHTILKPSGRAAHPLGVTGIAMLTVPVLYTVRKRWKRLAGLGTMRTWLEVHIFCGIVGPVLVTFHTSFKFNGIISVAYWSMMTVMASGFVGRYLYVRIPKSIRGTELTHQQIQARMAELTAELAAQGIETPLLDELVAADSVTRRERRRLRRTLTEAGAGRQSAATAVAILAERSVLRRRLRYLGRTKRLFGMWHMLHQPLVYVMFVIAALHVGVALYFGYSGW